LPSPRDIIRNLGIGSNRKGGPVPAQGRLVGEPPQGGMVRLAECEDGVQIRVAVWPGANGGIWPSRHFPQWSGDRPRRGTVLVVHGRTEFIEKYYPVIEMLLQRGFAVVTMDWRGQGLSERPVGHHLKGHVDNFKEYQRDLDAMFALREVQALPEPMVVMSHSMGGAVTLRRIAREPNRFIGAIFSSPMLGLLPAPGIDRVTGGVAKVVSGVGLRDEYAPGQPIDPYTDTLFMGNVLTSDFDEYTRQRELIKEEPGLAIAGVTWGWLRAAMNETARLEHIGPLSLPSLYWVGSEETVISAPAIAARVAINSNCRFALIAGAKHEPLFERPELRSRVWREIDHFLTKLDLLPKDR